MPILFLTQFHHSNIHNSRHLIDALSQWCVLVYLITIFGGANYTLQTRFCKLYGEPFCFNSANSASTARWKESKFRGIIKQEVDKASHRKFFFHFFLGSFFTFFGNSRKLETKFIDFFCAQMKTN